MKTFIKKHKFGILKLICMWSAWIAVFYFKRTIGADIDDWAWVGYSFLIMALSGLAGMFDAWGDKK